MSPRPSIEVRRLATAELPGAFQLVRQLRPHLDEAEFLRRVEIQARRGYELYAGFLDGRIVCLAGMRPVMTLARGPHMHLDDLVVDEAERNQKIGAQLLAFAEAEAQRRGLGKLFLDARKEAIPFYERNGYAFHPAPLMRKDF